MKNEKIKKNPKLSAVTNSFDLEKNLYGQGYNFIIGVDEAGRGPLAGPVVAGAVVLEERDFNEDEKKLWELIRDSKKLSEKRREDVFDFIMKNFEVGIGVCNHETIDRINILEATFLAMKKAIGELKNKIKIKDSRIIVLVDGDKIVPNFSIEQKAVVSGDKLIKTISAASIIAKVTRDRMMGDYDKQYPEYQFSKHKGYGTKAHIDALKEFGPCLIHRRTFAPVRNAINDRWKE